jgi:hypothetical protein
VRGFSKRYAGGPRQDDLCLRVHSSTSTLIAAVADGVSAASRADMAAALAVRQAAATVARQLNDGAIEICWREVFDQAAWALIEEHRRESAAPGASAEDAGASLATTLIVAAISASADVDPGCVGEGDEDGSQDPQTRSVQLAAVCDSPAYLLPGGTFALVVGESDEDDGLLGGGVRALPPGVRSVRTANCTLGPGDVLLLGARPRTVDAAGHSFDFAPAARLQSQHLRRRPHSGRGVASAQAVSTLALEFPAGRETAPFGRDSLALRVEQFGELTPVCRPGGQGRVYRPTRLPTTLDATPVVVKLYRRPITADPVRVLAEMVAWSRTLDRRQQARLHGVSAWPHGIVTRGERPIGIAMRDLSNPFEVPFVMPSGPRQRVPLSLEHLLGGDEYLQLRGLGVRPRTATRAGVAERISGALTNRHRHGIIASDIAPNNLLVGFGVQGPFVSFIACDSMVFHGRQALAPVETTDWQLPSGCAKPRGTRAADAYKLGLVVLRLFTRSHDARRPSPQIQCVPIELRGLLNRSLAAEAANRPPAGEWQRALRELLALGRLDARYPGRAPTPVRPRSPSQLRQHRPDPPAPRPSPPAQSRGRPPRRTGQRPLRVAWLALTVVVLAFVLMRLLAGAGPSLSSGGFAGPGTGQPNTPLQYDTQGGPAFGDDGSP